MKSVEFVNITLFDTPISHHRRSKTNLRGRASEIEQSTYTIRGTTVSIVAGKSVVTNRRLRKQ